MRSGEVSRRTFLQRAGIAGLAVAMAELPAFLDARGLLEEAAAQTADLTADTLNGLAAFVLPGDDAYSVAQGESHPGPGAIAAGTTRALIHSLDRYVPASTVAAGDRTLPSSGGIALLLNDYATRVNPAAARGGFPTQFARLSFGEKAEVFRQFESDPSLGESELRFVAGILPGFTAFLAFSEAGVWDPVGRELSGRAVGWDISGYAGPADGNRELRGYWKGHKKAIPTKRRRRRRSRR
jgi:hypothetical protein